MWELSGMRPCSSATGVLCKQPVVVMWRTPAMLTFLYGNFFWRLMVAQPVLDGMLTDMSRGSLLSRSCNEAKHWTVGIGFNYDNNLLIGIDLSAYLSTYGKTFCFKGFRNLLLCFPETALLILFLNLLVPLLLSVSFFVSKLCVHVVYTNTSVFASRSTIFCITL